MLELHQILYVCLLLLCCGYALWGGGAPERASAAVNFIASVASFVAAISVTHRWDRFMPGISIIDVLTLISVLAIAVVSDRFWTIWSFGFCAAENMAHLARAMQKTLPAWAYFRSEAIWAYPMLFLLVLGTWNHRRRMKATAAS